MRLLDKWLSRILDKSFQAEALGDLWEANYDMANQGIPKPFRAWVVIWRSILLILASIQIRQIEEGERFKRKLIMLEVGLALLAAAGGSFLFICLGHVENTCHLQHDLATGSHGQPSLES